METLRRDGKRTDGEGAKKPRRPGGGHLLFKRSAGGCLTVSEDGELSYDGPPTEDSVWDFDGVTEFGDDLPGMPNFIQHVASGKYLNLVRGGRDLALADEPPPITYNCRVYAKKFPTASLYIQDNEYGFVGRDNAFDALTVDDANPVLLAALSVSPACEGNFIYMDERGLAAVRTNGDEHELVFFTEATQVPKAGDDALSSCLWTVRGECEPDGYGVEARNVATGQFLHTDGNDFLLAPSAEEAVLGQEHTHWMGSLQFMMITDPENGMLYPRQAMLII